MEKRFKRAFSKDSASPQPKPAMPIPKAEGISSSAFSPEAIAKMEAELKKVGINLHKIGDGSSGLKVSLPKDDLSSSQSELARETDLVRNYMKMVAQEILGGDKRLLCMISGFYNDTPGARMNKSEGYIYINFYKLGKPAEEIGGESRMVFMDSRGSLDAANRSSIRKTFFSRLRELISIGEFREMEEFAVAKGNVPSSDLHYSIEPTWGTGRATRLNAIAASLKKLASEIEAERTRHPAGNFDPDDSIHKSWMFIKRTIYDLKADMLNETIDDFLSVMPWTLLRKKLEYIKRNAQISVRICLEDDLGTKIKDSESADRWLGWMANGDFLESGPSPSMKKLETGLVITGRLMEWFGKSKSGI